MHNDMESGLRQYKLGKVYDARKKHSTVNTYEWNLILIRWQNAGICQHGCYSEWCGCDGNLYDKVNPHHENIKELEINCQVTAMKTKFDAPDLHYFAWKMPEQQKAKCLLLGDVILLWHYLVPHSHPQPNIVLLFKNWLLSNTKFSASATFVYYI